MLELYTNPSVAGIICKAEEEILSITGRRIRLIPQRMELADAMPVKKLNERDLLLRNIICTLCGVTWEQLTSKSRKKEIVSARHLYSSYARTHLKLTFKEIGKNIGGRDHTTIINSLNCVRNLMFVRDDMMVRFVKAINEELKTAIHETKINKGRI